MRDDQERDETPSENGLKKNYEVPGLIKLGDVAELTNYDVSVIV